MKFSLIRKIITYVYARVVSWAKHKYASRYLALVSFAESSFFPVPPDIMLIPMAIAVPRKAWLYALLTTLFSVLGGAFGYLLGYIAFKPLLQPGLNFFGYSHLYDIMLEYFQNFGFFAVIFAGFTPIPYKLFTVGAGFLQYAFWPFILASIIGRSLRFFLVVICVRLGWQGFSLAKNKYG